MDNPRLGGQRPAPVTKDELIRVIDFIEQSRVEADSLPALAAPAPQWRMALFLMRRHLEGRLVTVSSLAAASGVPYATAMRRIDALFAAGLITRRSRTASGKSFAIHPTDLLTEAIRQHASRIKRLVGKTIGVPHRGDFDSFYFGASYLAGRIIPPPRPCPPWRGGNHSIRIAMFSDPTTRAMQDVVGEIERALGARLHISAYRLDGLREELWANAAKPVSNYDILPLDMPWVGEFAESGALLRLDEILKTSQFDQGDFHPTGWNAGRYHGVQYGVPIQTTPELLLYRTDLLAEAGLDPPLTTDAVLSVARILHRPQAGQFGIAWNGQRGTPIAHSFVQVMAGFGRPMLALRRVSGSFDTTAVRGEEMRPTVDTPEGLLTAMFLRELLSVSCPGVLDMAWDERVQAYRRGEVAMAYEWSIRAGVFEMDPDSPAQGRTGYLPLPHGPGAYRHVSPIGGFVLSIPANLTSDRMALSWRAIECLTSPEMMKLFTLNGSTVSPRFSVSADPEIMGACPVIPLVDQMERLAQIQAWPRPPVPAYSDCLMVLGSEVHDFMLGESEAPAMLRRAQRRLDEIMRARGYY